MTIADEEAEIPPKWCATTAYALAMIQTLTVAGTAYQDSIHWNEAYHFEAGFLLIWILLLAPAVLPLIFRKNCEIVMLCTIPVLGVFCARAYGIIRYWIGINSLSGQKGFDLAALWGILFGLLAALVVAGWIAVHAIAYLSARRGDLRATGNRVD